MCAIRSDERSSFLTAQEDLLHKTGLNVGCGSDIRHNYINLDKVPLPGVDVAWDVMRFPYPFEDDRFDSILLINVLEHIPDTIRTMEELFRISKPGAVTTIRVPCWNSIEQATDPTHVRSFSERSMDYFDPDKPLGSRRAYYSTARFTVKSVGAWINIGGRDLLIRNRFFCRVLFFLSHYISNIVHLLEYDLLALKS